MKKKLLGVCVGWLCLTAATALAADSVKIGVAAMISPKETVKYYKQMIDYVGTKLGRPVEMVQKENYDETDKLLESGELSFAFVCSGPYTKDHEKFGAELLVAPQSYGQPFYHAYIIVPKDSTVKDLAGLKGKKFAFTDPKSNTGKIVPTYMIGKEFNTTPEKFFGKTIFTRSHDKSIEAVAKKISDANVSHEDSSRGLREKCAMPSRANARYASSVIALRPTPTSAACGGSRPSRCGSRLSINRSSAERGCRRSSNG